MSAMGHKRTFSDTLSNVRYWGQSGRNQAKSGHTEKLTKSQLFPASEMAKLRCFYGALLCMDSAGGSKAGHFPPMPAADLPSLEQRLEARLIELERLYEARPRMSDALARAGAGQRIDELLEEIAELQQSIMLSPATSLQDAAVKLRRLSVYLEDWEPARLLEGALEAVERAVECA